jgi:acetyltransferase-like isoleucine patch superfamily enzyme
MPRRSRSSSIASTLRRRGIALTHLHCTVEIDRTAYLGPGFSLEIAGDGTFVAGPATAFEPGFHCEVGGSGRVAIGDRTAFDRLGLVHCATSIDIGSDCRIGPAILIVDGYHAYGDPERSYLDQGYRYRPVAIGAGVRIGAKCTVIGATIGDGTVIEPNSAVTSDLPARCVARGVPAKVVDYLEGADEGSDDSASRSDRSGASEPASAPADPASSQAARK